MNTTQANPLVKNRRTAIVVGVLYIIGTVAGILSVVFTQSILNAPDYLTKISSDQNRIVVGALFVLTMGFALAMVPVMLYPILKKQSEVLALGYVVIRGALETVMYIVSVIIWLFLIVVSQEYVAAGTAGSAYFQVLGSVLLKGNDSITTLLIIVFSLDALMLYYLLYSSNLIPRWISVWGFIAILLHLTTGFLILFQLQSAFSTINLVMNFPIFLQEMVMAVWLIVKGFNPTATASLFAKAATNELLRAS